MFPIAYRPTPETAHLQPQAVLTLDQLKELASQIGQTIAEQMPKPEVTVKAYERTQSSYTGSARATQPSVTIDESVIDVGIGKTEELKKGTGSANLAKKSAKSDTIEKSKAKLRQLKKGK
jgi:hypothetical protein